MPQSYFRAGGGPSDCTGSTSSAEIELTRRGSQMRQWEPQPSASRARAPTGLAPRVAAGQPPVSKAHLSAVANADRW